MTQPEIETRWLRRRKYRGQLLLLGSRTRLRCSRETLDSLSAFKAKRALPTWDATLNALLAESQRAEGSEGIIGEARQP